MQLQGDINERRKGKKFERKYFIILVDDNRALLVVIQSEDV